MDTAPERWNTVLITASPKTEQALRALLPRERIALQRCYADAGEARRGIAAQPPHLVIIAPPLPEENGLRLAEDLSRFESLGLMQLADAEDYERLAPAAQALGVFLLPRPFTRQSFQQALGLLCAMRRRLQTLETKAENLEARMDDIRVVNRAKSLLMSKLKMSESDAHRFIEKTAMDRCVKRRVVAESIIRTYSN